MIIVVFLVDSFRVQRIPFDGVLIAVVLVEVSWLPQLLKILSDDSALILPDNDCDVTVLYHV